MIDLLENPSGSQYESIVAFSLSGKLHDEDYKKFVPLVDESIKEVGKVRLLVKFHDFHGWDAKALWADIKFATTHCSSIDRIAMIGDTTWEKYMAVICKPFTLAKVKYFESSDIESAWTWLSE